MHEHDEHTVRPYASWVALASGLCALGFALYVLFSGDVVAALSVQPKDDPLLMTALVEGIVGTLAAVVAIARKEPKRLALLGLFVSLVAIVTKFFLAILAVALFILVVFAVIAALN